MVLPVGTVLLSRGIGPGYWHDIAILVGEGLVVEVKFDRPVLSRLDEYEHRGLEWIPLIPVSAKIGRAAARIATGLAGRALYSTSSSVALDGQNSATSLLVLSFGLSSLESLDHISLTSTGVFES